MKQMSVRRGTAAIYLVFLWAIVICMPVFSVDAVLLNKIPLSNTSGKGGLRLGDVTGDGRIDLVIGQQIGGGHKFPSEVRCVTVYDLEGNFLWQREPRRATTCRYRIFPCRYMI